MSFRGQTVTGALCEEHGNVVARERSGLRDHRRNLGTTKVGRALTDPNSKPRFQLILDSEPLNIVGDTPEARVNPASRSGFSTRRLRSMSRSRRSGHRQGRVVVDNSQADIPSITALISDQQNSEDGRLDNIA